MLRIFLVTLFLAFSLCALDLQHANRYTHQDIRGWYMSEKLDGIRAYWDGKELLTRKGNKIHAPEWFLADLPPFALDGELWSTRGAFEEIQSIVLQKEPDKRWSGIVYMVFDAPTSLGDFPKRLEKIAEYKEQYPLAHLQIIEQKVCKDHKALEGFLDEVLEKKGEGVMVKNPKLIYTTGRSDAILKVKKWDEIEAQVLGYKMGKGKYSGMVGSLHVILEDGVKFFVGSGLSDKERANPPKIGDIVTIKHYGYTKNSKPKFASFMRIRKD